MRLSDNDLSNILYRIADIIRAYEEISELNNCNTCGRKNCQNKPIAGQMIRINCFDWREENETV